MEKQPALWGKLDKQACWAVVSTLAFWFIAHAYRFFNASFSHDSLYVDLTSNGLHQVGIGRFLVPVVAAIRGEISAPWLLCLLGGVFLAASVLLIVKLFNIKKPVSIVLSAAILATNSAVTLLNATYVHDTDLYMMALFLGLLGLWFLRKGRAWFVLGGCLLALSMGLYQAYMQVVAICIVLLLVQDLLNGKQVRPVLIEAGKAVLFMLIAGVLYYALMHLTQSLTGAGMVNSYNGLTGVGDYSEASLPALIWQAWKYPFWCYLHPTVSHVMLTVAATGIMGVLAVVALVALMVLRKLGPASIALVVVLLVVAPLAMDIVFVISKGLVHSLMIFSFFIPFVFALALFEMLEESLAQRKHASGKARSVSAWGRVVVLVMAGVFVFNSVVYANDVYLKKDLEYQSTLSLATRVLERVESTEGYQPGVTPVAFAGDLSASPALGTRTGFDELYGMGLQYKTAVSYADTMENYLDYVLDANVNVAKAADYMNRPEVQAMPVYPAGGCCAYIDGVLVIKISDQLTL